MDVAIKKVGERDGQDRFVLVNATTRQVVTANDVSEDAIKRFFRELGAEDHLIADCIDRAREYYEAGDGPPVDEAAETQGDGDLLFELGLDEDDDA